MIALPNSCFSLTLPAYAAFWTCFSDSFPVWTCPNWIVQRFVVNGEQSASEIRLHRNSMFLKATHVFPRGVRFSWKKAVSTEGWSCGGPSRDFRVFGNNFQKLLPNFSEVTWWENLHINNALWGSFLEVCLRNPGTSQKLLQKSALRCIPLFSVWGMPLVRAMKRKKHIECSWQCWSGIVGVQSGAKGQPCKLKLHPPFASLV